MLDDSLEILRAYYPEALSFYLDLIRGNNPASFTRHRKLDLSDLLLQMAGRKRGFLVSGGEINTERMAKVLVDEYRSGKLGRFTLEVPANE